MSVHRLIVFTEAVPGRDPEEVAREFRQRNLRQGWACAAKLT